MLVLYSLFISYLVKHDCYPTFICCLVSDKWISRICIFTYYFLFFPFSFLSVWFSFFLFSFFFFLFIFLFFYFLISFFFILMNLFIYLLIYLPNIILKPIFASWICHRTFIAMEVFCTRICLLGFVLEVSVYCIMCRFLVTVID